MRPVFGAWRNIVACRPGVSAALRLARRTIRRVILKRRILAGRGKKWFRSAVKPCGWAIFPAADFFGKRLPETFRLRVEKPGEQNNKKGHEALGTGFLGGPNSAFSFGILEISKLLREHESWPVLAQLQCGRQCRANDSTAARVNSTCEPKPDCHVGRAKSGRLAALLGTLKHPALTAPA